MNNSDMKNKFPIWMKPEALVWLEIKDASG